MARILIVDDERGIRDFMVQVLEAERHTVVEAENGDDALGRLSRHAFDLVFTDLRMPGIDGIELVRRIRELYRDTEIIVMTAHGTVATAVEAMRLGAFDFVEKPLDSIDAVNLLAARALERRRLLNVREQVARDSSAEEPLRYRDPVMDGVVELIRKVAPTNASVLLLGESGTGKEVAARIIHRWSRRSTGPFVAVNCASLPDDLVESELFGHEKGAFTGAVDRQRGRIELAQEGSFFLDEVAEMKLDLQAKLLRVVQHRSFERVGGRQTIECDVRWIAATNRNLQEHLRAGRFREDLYHRLAVFPIVLPPLRERRKDIVPLALRLLEKSARTLGTPVPELPEDVRELLEANAWPGNIRQLANVMERAAILCDGATILPPHILAERAARPEQPRNEQPARGSLAEVELDTIRRTLADTEWNRGKAAEQLGISVRTLYEKIKTYNLDKETG